ncbi:hypothetical protein [Tardiphaga sp. P5_C7]|jgi:hypothetical protein
MGERYQLQQMQYQADPDTGEKVEWGHAVQRLSDMVSIPPDPHNSDYARFLTDKENGAEVLPFVPPPLPVPASISDRQFFQQLAVAGIISEDEALASNAAVIPAPLLALIEQMPAAQRFGVKMLVSGATTFERENNVTIAIGQAYGMTSDQIDQFFTAAAAL